MNILLENDCWQRAPMHPRRPTGSGWSGVKHRESRHGCVLPMETLPTRLLLYAPAGSFLNTLSR